MKSYILKVCLFSYIISVPPLFSTPGEQPLYRLYEEKIQTILKECKITISNEHLKYIVKKVLLSRKNNALTILEGTKKESSSSLMNEAFYLNNEMINFTLNKLIDDKKHLDTVYHIIAWSYNKILQKLYFDFCCDKKKWLYPKNEALFHSVLHQYLTDIYKHKTIPISNVLSIKVLCIISKDLASKILDALQS